MKRDFMQMLKSKYDAWLIVSVKEHEDNGVTHDAFLIFSEDGKVYHKDHNEDEKSYATIDENELVEGVREDDFLEYHYWSLKKVLEEMEDGKVKERFTKIVEELKHKHEEFWKTYSGR